MENNALKLNLKFNILSFFFICLLKNQTQLFNKKSLVDASEMEYIKDLSDTEMQEETYDTISLENSEPNQTRSAFFENFSLNFQ